MIDVQGVSKSYGTTKALDRISFSVGENQILGFLGPNGAGKSTAMKVITTFLSPDEGTVTVDGIDVTKDPLSVRKRIGYLPEVAPLYDEMRTGDYLNWVAKARGLDGTRLTDRVNWVIVATSIRSVLMKPINALSKGYRQRLGLAQALVHDPDILVLDEPTSGLDPRQIIDIRNLIADLARSKTIIFSSHILAEISAVTNRIVIINEGQIVADGEIEQLRRQAMTANRLVVALAAPDAEAESAVKSLGGVTSVEHRETGQNGSRELVVTTPIDKDLRPEINALARQKGWDFLALHADPPSLEEAFIQLTGKEVVRS